MSSMEYHMNNQEKHVSMKYIYLCEFSFFLDLSYIGHVVLIFVDLN
jgi:hypothetical protein